MLLSLPLLMFHPHKCSSVAPFPSPVQQSVFLAYGCLEWANLSGPWGKKPLRDSLPSWISCAYCSKGHECKSWRSSGFFFGRLGIFKYAFRTNVLSLFSCFKGVFLIRFFSNRFFFKLVKILPLAYILHGLCQWHFWKFWNFYNT